GALAVSAQDDRPVGTMRATASQDQQAERPVATPALGPILRYRFRKGDQFRYVVEKKMETTSTTAGNQRSTLTTQTYDVSWRVTNVDSNGNARMTLTIDRLRYEQDNGFPGKVEFDSQKHRNPQGAPAGVRVLSAILKAQVGAQFTCTISPRGEVSDFK